MEKAKTQAVSFPCPGDAPSFSTLFRRMLLSFSGVILPRERSFFLSFAMNAPPFPSPLVYDTFTFPFSPSHGEKETRTTASNGDGRSFFFSLPRWQSSIFLPPFTLPPRRMHEDAAPAGPFPFFFSFSPFAMRALRQVGTAVTRRRFFLFFVGACSSRDSLIPSFFLLLLST